MAEGPAVNPNVDDIADRAKHWYANATQVLAATQYRLAELAGTGRLDPDESMSLQTNLFQFGRPCMPAPWALCATGTRTIAPGMRSTTRTATVARSGSRFGSSPSRPRIPPGSTTDSCSATAPSMSIGSERSATSRRSSPTTRTSMISIYGCSTDMGSFLSRGQSEAAAVTVVAAAASLAR